MRAYLHIGTEKTGSTTIQAFLNDARQELADKSIFVPASLGQINHRKLPVFAYPAEFQDDFTSSEGINDAERRLSKVAEWKDQFQSEVEQAQKRGLDTIVLSSEHLQSRLSAPVSVAALRDYLLGLVKDIKVVLYIRHPYATAVSLFSTAIKTGSKIDTMFTPNTPYIENLVHHKNTIERWGDVFGYDNLTVRIFEREALVNHSLIEDFQVQCGVAQPLNFDAAPQNETLNALGLAILRKINELDVPMESFERPYKARDALVQLFEENFSKGTLYQGSAQSLEEFEEYYAASNEYVRKEFFPYRERLFKPFRFKTGDHDNSDHVEQIARFLAKLWVEGRLGRDQN